MYKNNIPQPADTLKTSQSDLLGNFQAIKTLIDVNHGTFGAADQGKHKFIQFPLQTVSPNTDLNEMALFSKNGTVSATPELWIKYENNSEEVAFTEGFTAANEGWMRTPQGYLLKWGFQDFTAFGGNSRPDTVIFNPAFPVYTSIYHIEMSASIIAAEIDPRSISYIISDTINILNFQVLTASYRTGFSAYRVYYYAIGS